MIIPDELEHQMTLRSAVTRFDDLRARDSLADRTAEEQTAASAPPLDRAEALELLALGEIIARKAGYGRQLAVRTARAAGASWSQIGLALGTTKQAAWEAHARWIDQQVQEHERSGYEGLNQAEAARARALTGAPDEDDEEA